MISAIVLAAFATFQLEIPLVDLVVEPAKGFSHSSALVGGVITDSKPREVPRLPLAVKLESISMAPSQPDLRIVVVLVTNVSGAPYALAVGRDGGAALSPGNRGRREVSFWLRSAPRPDNSLGTLGGTLVYASEDTTGSLLALPPGGSVRVRFPANLKLAFRAVYEWKKAGVRGVDVRADVAETLYADRTDNYYVQRTTSVISDNSLTMPLE